MPATTSIVSAVSAGASSRKARGGRPAKSRPVLGRLPDRTSLDVEQFAA